MSTPFDESACARLLVAARQDRAKVAHALIAPRDRAAAFAVQDATLALLGPAAGWKVGAKGPELEPGCAPLPASGVLSSRAKLPDGPWRLRGIEVEVALRLGRGLAPTTPHVDVAELQAAVESIVPAIEVVETRLQDWQGSDPLAQLADLQSHGALVVGEPGALRPVDLDLRTVEAYLAFDGQPVASTRGANTAADVWRLLGWLAWHCVQRGQPLRAGDVVTTGSCTGLLFAPEGARVHAQLPGIGSVEVQF